MSVVYILVFVAILMAGGFLVAFVWAVKSGQYEDTYTPSVRILFEDVQVKSKEKGAEGVELENGKGDSVNGKNSGINSPLAQNQKPKLGK